jgi:hypothetical protein
MKKSNKSSLQAGLWILVWFLVVGVVIAGLGYWEWGLLKGGLNEFQQRVHDAQLLNEIELCLKTVSLKVALVLAGSFAVIGFLLWLSLRSVIRRQVAKDALVVPPVSVSAKKESLVRQEPSPEDKKREAQRDQRRSLHLLSLLQREGRLVDFLQEDLQAYEDAQIGAAVRGIQEACRESLKKYVAPAPVIDKEEGESITVDEGFDANAIRLTGNVSGRPPFKGILQHRGWRSVGLNLPSLSGSSDPAIIAPAEVEIQ